MNLIDWLIDSSHFMPRTHCGDVEGWTPLLVFLNQTSEVNIGIAYLVIPLLWIMRWDLYLRHGETPQHPWLQVSVAGAFVMLCGCTHWMSRLMFQVPVYRLTTLVLLLCAVASWASIVLLILPNQWRSRSKRAAPLGA